jgi:hypothetical protein
MNNNKNQQAGWVAKAKELLLVIEKNDTAFVSRYPETVIVSSASFEAMRQLSLIVSKLVDDVERQEEIETEIEETTMSAEEWEAVVEEAIKTTRAERHAAVMEAALDSFCRVRNLRRPNTNA